MKWFQHISTSLDDPFIFELIDRFGGDGYLVFFGTLEVMAREFDINSPGFCRVSGRFLTRKLQLSRQKVVKILNFCNEKGRILFNIDGTDFELNCPKLKSMCDEYTQKRLGSKSGQAREFVGHIEREVERDIEVKEESTTLGPDPASRGTGPPPKEKPPAPYYNVKPNGSHEEYMERVKAVFRRLLEERGETWAEEYPNYGGFQGVRTEMFRAYEWLEARPAERKQRLLVFVSGWMGRNHDRAGGGTLASPGQRQSKGMTSIDSAVAWAKGEPGG